MRQFCLCIYAFTDLLSTFRAPEIMLKFSFSEGIRELVGMWCPAIVIFTIAGCHINILPSAEPQKKTYINRKLFPSVPSGCLWSQEAISECLHWQSRVCAWDTCPAATADIQASPVATNWLLSFRRWRWIHMTPYHQPAVSKNTILFSLHTLNTHRPQIPNCYTGYCEKQNTFFMGENYVVEKEMVVD